MHATCRRRQLASQPLLTSGRLGRWTLSHPAQDPFRSFSEVMPLCIMLMYRLSAIHILHRLNRGKAKLCLMIQAP